MCIFKMILNRNTCIHLCGTSVQDISKAQFRQVKQVCMYHRSSNIEVVHIITERLQAVITSKLDGDSTRCTFGGVLCTSVFSAISQLVRKADECRAKQHTRCRMQLWASDRHVHSYRNLLKLMVYICINCIHICVVTSELQQNMLNVDKSEGASWCLIWARVQW